MASEQSTGTDYDIIVIGGGPAGSTAAALLAREGRRVAIFDRDKWPRYHIGESLLPGVLPFLEELGAMEAMEAEGFHRKTGQTFRWGPDRTPWQLDFRQLDVYPYSYFVERSAFDHVLLKNAARLGAEVHEESSVEGLLMDGPQVRGIRVKTRGAETRPVTARYVIDCSGQNALLAREFKTRRWVKGLRNLAVWSYWEGTTPLPPPQDEHILTISIPDGWIWFLPMRNGRVSVGVVTLDWTSDKGRPNGAMQGSVEEWYRRTVTGSETIGELLKNARQVEEIRAQRDWSYCTTRFHGPGYCLAGDAACFIDPILSTGVQLAMTGGYLSALAINSSLAQPADEAAFFRYYQQTYLATYREQLTQIRYFYRTEAHQDSIFWKSKRLLRVDPQLDGALSFVFLNSGLARHVTADRPHDTPGQARALFHEIRDAKTAAVGYRTRSGRRQLVPEGGLVVVQRSDRRLYSVYQEGLRLVLEPTRSERWSHRPEGTAALIEIDEARTGTPIGTLVIEAASADLPKGLQVRHGIVCRSRLYGGVKGFESLLAEAAGSILAEAQPDDVRNIPAYEARVRKQFSTASDRAWGFAKLPPIDSLALVEHPIAVEYRHRITGHSVWVIAQTRRDPRVDEAPFARTRFVDFGYSGDGASAAEVIQLTDAVVSHAREALRSVATVSAALDICQQVFVDDSVVPEGWELVVVRRMAPNRWADDPNDDASDIADAPAA